MAVMSERARKLLHDAMDLPVSERAELAADLLASLDGEPEAGVEAAGASEIEQRAREALANPDDDLSWESVRAELHAAHASRVGVGRAMTDAPRGRYRP
jgi:putative addiction module component (TIGR02574 family)